MDCGLPLRLWRDIEMFQPFDLNEVLLVEENSWHVSLSSPPAPEPPWLAPDSWGLDPIYQYGFDLFLGIFEKAVSQRIVQELSLSDDLIEEFDDSRDRDGISCVIRLGINTARELVIEDSRISTLPWALTALQNGKPLSIDAFDAFGRDLLLRILSTISLKQEALKQDTGELATESMERLITGWEQLNLINEEVRQDLSIPWGQYSHRVVIVAHRLKKKRIEESEPFTEPNQTSSGSDGDPKPEQIKSSSNDSAATETNGLYGSKDPLKTSSSSPRIRRRCEILNSFFLRDLQRVAQHVPKISKNCALHRYLNGKEDPNRLDVAAFSDNLSEKVAPSNIPLGRWPHRETHYNSLMQQLAINEFMSGKHTLFSVNGPPGTGKTTLIKDIVAATIVQRALKLVRYRKADDAFEKQRVDCEIDRNRFSLRKLRKELTGFEIVVASNNNSAVENITRELPKRSNLGESFSNSRYLEEVISLYQRIRSGRGREQHRTEQNQQVLRPTNAAESLQPAEEYWGLISIPLGNKANRELFLGALLYGPSEDKDQKRDRTAGRKLLTLSEWRREIIGEGTITFAKARLLFLEAQKKAEEALLSTSAHSDFGLISSQHRFHSREVQERTPWMTEELHARQSELFINALVLHEAWIREASGIQGNISALAKFLSRPESVQPHPALVVWQTLAMIVPVISTTLASVERMFASLGEQSIGTVILEEAGQATPQSAVGAIWRAKRALVIGDPMQIPPVVATPSGLVRHFVQQHGTDRAIHSPLSSSTQSLADESNPIGTALDNGHSRLWVGCPLRVHRRCIEPMFSIANTIAYGGLMTYGTSISPENEALLDSIPTSCWFDIRGACSGRHFVPQQGIFLLSLLQRLRSISPTELPDIFIISPFRSVRERLSRLVYEQSRALGFSAILIKELRKRIGTVHTFQGKEADIVILVLGCDESSRGAARWAGEQPNILNVAVTRARHRIFVVGSLPLWHNKGFFSELAASLPRRDGSVL